MQLFPLRGKKCLIYDISLADAYMEAGPSFSRESIIDLFRRRLSQKLKRHGIVVLDNDNSDRKREITISVQFTKILRGFSSLPPIYDYSCYKGLDAEPVVGLKSKVLVDGIELQEAAVTARLSFVLNQT